MRHFALLLIVGSAFGVFAQTFDKDIKFPVYDVPEKFQVGIPVSYITNKTSEFGEVHFSNDDFHYYPYNITEFIVVYKGISDDFLQGYYARTGPLPVSTSQEFKKIEPLYDYIKAGEYYVLTPSAVHKVLPEFFSTPLKDLHYDYFSDVDINKQIPLVFLIPTSYFTEDSFEKLIHIADYEISQGGVLAITEYENTRITRGTASGSSDEVDGVSEGVLAESEEFVHGLSYQGHPINKRQTWVRRPHVDDDDY